MEVLFELGLFAFHVANCPTDLAKEVSALFPSSSRLGLPVLMMDVEALGFDCVTDFVGYCMGVHTNCLWLGGASVVAPNGQKVLFLGSSHSGKTTLVLLLLMSKGWKLLSEDVTLIEPASARVVPFASPFAVREFSRKLVAGLGASGVESDSLWRSAVSFMASEDTKTQFDYCVELNRISESAIVCHEVESDSVLAELCKKSNVLRFPGGVKLAETCLQSTKCFRFSGGNSESRLDAVVDLLK